MKEKRLLKAMSQVEEKYVEEASPARRPKSSGWLKRGAMAACLALVLVLAVHFAVANNGDEVTSQGIADAAPMVYVNDILYKQSVSEQSYPERKDEFVYLGQILSDVTSNQSSDTDGIPKENFQANHPVVGCEVYQYGEDIVLHINGAYWLYMRYERNTN
ncbi:MAG: entericidin like toxin protein [bacterium]|nr:entericidin like toxin protein [bacterium]